MSDTLGINFTQKHKAYKLCGCKPFYGVIHKEELRGYDYWGFGDIDLIYGDLSLRRIRVVDQFPDVDQPVPDKKNAKAAKLPYIVYRIPAVCTVKVTDGTKVLMQSRIPVYQMGIESNMPLVSESKK